MVTRCLTRGVLMLGCTGPAFSDATGGTTVSANASAGAASGRRSRRLAAAAHGAALRRALQRPLTVADWTNGTGLVQVSCCARARVCVC